MNTEQIFDTFSRFSDIIHAKSEINRLTLEVINEGRTCGSCSYWMTQQCGREKAGHKVTCNEFKCSSFLIDPISLGIIQGKEKQIEVLKLKLCQQ